MYAEANAKVTLVIEGEAGPFGWHMGAGVSTGGGIKDDSLKVKVEGLGVQVG